MKGKIICYNLKSSNLSQSEIIRFLQEFAGYDNKSNYGKYAYHRQGVLDRILYIKPVRSVIVVSNEESQQIINALKKHKINTYIRNITLTDSDLKILKKDE